MGFIASASGAGGNSEIVPIVKWNAVNGRFYMVDRTPDAGGVWTSEDIGVALPVRFVADLENIKFGWTAFVNSRPDFHLVPLADLTSGAIAMPERPSLEHRVSFVVRIYAKSMGLREWRGQSKCVLSAMDKIYSAYQELKDLEDNVGKLPVVEITDVKEIRREGPYPGIDMQPVMSIQEKWVTRPEPLVPAKSVPEQLTNGAAEPQTNVTAMRPAPTASRPSAHIPPPPRPTQTQVKAAQAMQAPATTPPAGDDEAEFV